MTRGLLFSALAAIALGAFAIGLAGGAQRSARAAISPTPEPISGRTLFFYDDLHGNQIEYFAPNGRSYLWYPGKTAVIFGNWKVEGDKFCLRYGPHDYNPVTGEYAGDWRCYIRQDWAQGVRSSRPKDIFALSSGAGPTVLWLIRSSPKPTL